MRGLLAVAAIAATSAAAHAAPVVTVKARTAIQLDPVRRVPGGVELRGALLDRSQRAAVPWATLSIWLDDAHRLVQTDDAGEFALTYPVTEGVHSLRVEYVGDRHYASSSAELASFDVTKDPVALTVRASREVPAGQGNLRVAVAARSEHGPVSVPVALSIAGPAGREVPLGSVTTDGDGRVETALATASLGDPGRKRLIARFDGNDAYDVATAETELLVVTATAVSLDVADDDVPFEGSLRARGRLIDGHGAGIAQAPVALVAGQRRIADALTGADGSFAFEVPASELGTGTLPVQARFEAADAWRKSSRSPPVSITVSDPQPVPIGYTLGAFAATSFAVLAFVLLRTRPWAGLLERLRTAPEIAEPPGAESSGGAAAIDQVRTGLAPARPGLVSTLRRANDAVFSGTICDAVTRRPLARAALRLELGEQVVSLATDERGRFDAGELAPGTWRCSAAQPAYCTEQFDAVIPHRGELRGARIDLMQVRERVFRMYRELAVPLLPEPGHWGIWTPRQIFDFVRAQRPAPALAELTDYVEETYFSGRLPHEEALSAARARIERAASERQQAGL